jgi:hypothetical protein
MNDESLNIELCRAVTQPWIPNKQRTHGIQGQRLVSNDLTGKMEEEIVCNRW